METLFVRHGRGRGAWLALVLGLWSGFAAAQSAEAEHSSNAPRQRWLRFFGDDAHAIDRQRLHVRPDGLLESATRYPRTSREGWSAEQNAQGYYEYLERLIDCRTGLHVNTALVLLDERDRTIGRQERSLDDQLEQIALRQDEVRSHRWPGGSEIWLACVAAAAPQLVQGDTMPEADVPVYDFAAIGDAPPADTRGLFHALRAQYDAWLARTVPGPQVAATMRTELMTPLRPPGGERRLVVDASDFDLDSLRHHGGGVIEVTARMDRVERWPAGVPESARVEQTLDIDCRNGLSVPVRQRFLDSRSGALQLERSAPVFTTLEQMAQAARWEAGGWREWLGPDADTAPARLCRLAAQRCGAPVGNRAFELDPVRLGHQPGAPLLLAARAIWLQHRATFVPACLLGDQ